MDRTESAAVLESLIAGYPRMDLEDATLTAWVEAIEDTGADPAQALETARRWARTHERFPHLAEFLTTITPRTYLRIVDDPDEMRVPPVVARQMGRLWRQAIDDANAKAERARSGRGVVGHWHGGPDPCPMCGGSRPL